MFEIETKEYIRNDPDLKAPNVKEFIDKKEFEFRIREIKKCKKDICYFAEKYFTIVSPGKGKHIIKLYDFQKKLLNFFVNEDRCIVLSSRQVGKTTTYSIFALWTALFYPEKKILISANRFSAAIEFLSRMRLAYKLIPNWLKPGIVVWNKSSMEFSNGSSIFGTATSESSARGMSCNIVILDEFAFVPNNIARDFWNSVYPVISSAKNTKMIIVSTPNGTGNLYYELWNSAILGIDKDGWKPFRVDWWEVPGRDEEWKNKTIASLGSMIAFNQEFGNQFIGSSYTLLDTETIKKLKKNLIKDKDKIKKIKLEPIGYEFEIYEEPDPNRTYICGADVGDGIGADYSKVHIYDVTNIRDAKLVAYFSDNLISTTDFSYLLIYMAILYNECPIGIENNGIGNRVVNNLWFNYQYENILHYGGKRDNLGIFSHNSVKVKACLWLRDLLNFSETNLKLFKGEIINELEYFEKKINTQQTVFKAVEGKHDDEVMAMVWAFFLLHEENIEYFFDVDLSRIYNIYKIPIQIKAYNNKYFIKREITFEEKIERINEIFNKVFLEKSEINVDKNQDNNDNFFFANINGDSIEW